MPKLYVGSLPEGCDAASLEALFAKYGKVEECDIVKNYAFVHMSSEDESKMAIDALHNSEFMGGKITVEASHSKVRPKPGMGGRGQCYRCGRQGHWSKECPRNPNARFGAAVPMLPPGGGGGPLARYPGVGGGPDRLGYGSGGPDRFLDRGGAYGDRGFGAAPGYGDRMRPYPDPYERRAAPPPPPSAARDDFYYYRRPYEDFGSSYYGSQDGPSQSYGNGYRCTDWPTPCSKWTSPQILRQWCWSGMCSLRALLLQVFLKFPPGWTSIKSCLLMCGLFLNMCCASMHDSRTIGVIDCCWL
ncbi:uncharacterized protein LOC144132929 isoform X1 [Amblyomma americanum]